MTKLTPEQEQAIADKFLRQCMMHISNASETQKNILMRSLLARPPEGRQALDAAYALWNGLEQTDLMKLLGIVQKQFDQETWEFISRWRK